jgi:hypothetical protein
MSADSLQGVAERVVRRAQRQGFVLPREVREELSQAGADDGLWKDVVALARPALHFRQGRYYYASPVSERVRQEQAQQADVQRAVRSIVRAHRAAERARVERRNQDRIDFIQSVKVRTEDGRELTLLSRDLSPTGIRLIGTTRLLGQKVRVQLLSSAGLWEVLVRVLWTCVVGDDLFENGGTFVAVTAEPS